MYTTLAPIQWAVKQEPTLEAAYPIGSRWETSDGQIVQIMAITDCPFYTPEPDGSRWAYCLVLRWDLRAAGYVDAGATDYYLLAG